MPLSSHPILKLAHLLAECDCFRVFLVLIIFLSFLKWEEVPFAETRVFFKEFLLAASERCDRDFQCDPLGKSASETEGSQNQSVSKAQLEEIWLTVRLASSWAGETADSRDYYKANLIRQQIGRKYASHGACSQREHTMRMANQAKPCL